MAFRTGAWATVWEVSPRESGKSTNVKLSTSKKVSEGQYENDFSGMCLFIGQAHKDAASLKRLDRICLGDCEVTTSYNKEKDVQYTFYKVFTFEKTASDGGKQTSSPPANTEPNLDEGDMPEDALPW